MNSTTTLLSFNALYILIFSGLSLKNQNYEFFYYVIALLIILVLLWRHHNKEKLSLGLLWALSLWGLLHLMGGNIPIGNGEILYYLQLLPFLRYDQFVHFYGFGVATILAYELLAPFLKKSATWPLTALLLVMVGTGFGAFNEVVEFLATQIFAETNVGDYVNNMMDLVFNLLGALGALLLIYPRFKANRINGSKKL